MTHSSFNEGRELVIDSLCTGYGGLDLGTVAAFGSGRLAWTADPDPHIATITAARMPEASNLGDLRVVDFSQVEPVDVLTAGFPDCPNAATEPVVQRSLRDYGTAVWVGGNPQCQHSLGTTPHQRRTVKKTGIGRNAGSRDKHCRKCGAITADKQYGLETTIEEYVNRIRNVSREIARILLPEGTYWLNLRDGYSYHNSGSGSTRRILPEEQSDVVRHKSLIGIPWRVALSLQRDGWIVRNAIVWHKPNGIPDPASDRFSSRYETLFLLTKQPDYYFHLSSVREPLSSDRPVHRKNHRGGNKPHTVKSVWRPSGLSKNPGDVWSLPTRPLPEAHCAPFPVDLPCRCIAAGCPEHGRVLDPFSGAGTTGLAAVQLGRSYQGIDLRSDYHEIFRRRLLGEQPSGVWKAA